jgi:hypothetical protein
MERTEILRVRQIAISLGNGGYPSNLSANSKDALTKLVESHDEMFNRIKILEQYNAQLEKQMHVVKVFEENMVEAYQLMLKIKSWLLK